MECLAFKCVFNKDGNCVNYTNNRYKSVKQVAIPRVRNGILDTKLKYSVEKCDDVHMSLSILCGETKKSQYLICNTCQYSRSCKKCVYLEHGVICKKCIDLLTNFIKWE